MLFQDYLKEHKIISDGSFGTYYENAFQTEETPELANELHPERVVEIHKAYLMAGARFLRTNTFSSNTHELKTDMEQVKNNIKAAVALARKAVEESGISEPVFIAGDIGPIPVDGLEKREKATEEYYEIAKCFVESGIDIINFETFSSLDLIEPVIKKIYEESKVFIQVLFSVNQFGYSSAGLRAEKLFSMASDMDEISLVGLNCGVGPTHMEGILRKLTTRGKYVAALPNAGYPKRIRNHISFTDNEKYYGEKIKQIMDCDVDMIGGCCGTTPDYIRSFASEIDLRQFPHKTLEPVKKEAPKVVCDNSFYSKSKHEAGKKVIAVELAPPLNADDKKILEAAYMMRDFGVDVLTFPDSPSGRTRIDSILMAEKVRRETGLAVMPHICCRDKNAIAIRSMLLGAHINDIYNLLVMTGDPIPTMARSTTKAVFQFDAVGMMKLIRDMNEEMFQESPMCYGGVINYNRPNIEFEKSRVIKKMEAGASFFLTQPVFTLEQAQRLREIKQDTGAFILCGIMPLVSKKNAIFMKNEIAGVPVTDEIIERYPEQGTKEDSEAVGISIAREIILDLKKDVDGFYFSFPFNRVHMLGKIMDGGILDVE